MITSMLLPYGLLPGLRNERLEPFRPNHRNSKLFLQIPILPILRIMCIHRLRL